MSQPPPRDRKKKVTAPVHPAHQAGETGGTGSATGAPPVAPEAPKEAPQTPAVAPEAPGEGEGTGGPPGDGQGGDGDSGVEPGQQPGSQDPAEKVAEPPAGVTVDDAVVIAPPNGTAPVPPADGVVVDASPVPHGQRLPDMGQILARRGPSTMDPQLHALLTRGMEVEFMKVGTAFAQMMKRSADLTAQVNLARQQGYPESDIVKLAIKHNWEVPPTEEQLRQ